MTINERVELLESQLATALAKIDELTKNTEQKAISPYSAVGGVRDRTIIRPLDSSSGRGQINGGGIPWHSCESDHYNVKLEPTDPATKTNPVAIAYNKHSHSRWTGGALMADLLEFVQYVWAGTGITNKQSQSFWQTKPEIESIVDSNGKTVQKIGKMGLFFDPDTLRWGTTALEIDIKKCMLVEYNGVDEFGSPVIALDENGNPKSSPLFNEDSTKSGIVWDKNAQCFRFYATYAPGESNEA